MKKTFLFTLTSLILSITSSIAQETSAIDIDRKIKFNFERYTGTKTTSFRQGELILIKLNRTDTTFVFYGNLLDATPNSVTLDLNSLEKDTDTDHTDYYEAKDYYNTKLVTIPYEDIEFISKEKSRSGVGASIFGVGLIGAIIAPLACIDKKAESGFNAKRYVTILKYAAITAGTGIITAIAFADYGRSPVKPKLISIKKP